jgi:hypothetical protein
MHCKGKGKKKSSSKVRSYSMTKKKTATKKKPSSKVKSYAMTKKKGKAFKPCAKCPFPSKCKKAGKCLLHKH